MTSAPVDKSLTPTRSQQAGLSLKVTDAKAAAKAKRTTSTDASVAPAEGGFNCLESIDRFFSGIGEDDFLEETVRLDYFAHLDCNFTLASIEAQAGVFDRSDSFNGESFDGRLLSTGTYEYREWDFQADSFGALGVQARTYNGARRLEPAYELYLLAPEGLTWGGCNPVPGLRYLICEGLNTNYLHIMLGTGPLNSGLTKACRDQRIALDPEQARLFTSTGGAPASTQIIRRVPAVKNEVIGFKRDLCTMVGDFNGANNFASQRGLQLWNVAVNRAKAGDASGDERPLYWARLSLTTALRQWRAPFGDTANQRILADRAARGMTSHSFGGAAKKVFVSGFDPFSLDSNIWQGNASGAIAMQLDGTFDASGREIQAVVFPVRYAEFNAGLVEEVFRPHLQGGSQQATLITTVSLAPGSGQFDLEVYNGRNRSSDTFRDNMGQCAVSSCTATTANPQEPPGMGPGTVFGTQFVATTLPVHKMQQVQSTYPVRVNTSKQETAGGVAIVGSGGGFLSNEIAYRVTRLRDELKVGVAAGHVHVPGPVTASGAVHPALDSSRVAIVNEYQQILRLGNPIDSPRVFVATHYRDFLNRDVAIDVGGWKFWTDQIVDPVNPANHCAFADAVCIDREQVHVSLAFWYSTDFLNAHPGLRNPPGVSPDFNNAEFIRQCYLVYLQKQPDSGSSFWLDELNRTNDYFHIVHAFLLSTEYRARFGPT